MNLTTQQGVCLAQYRQPRTHSSGAVMHRGATLSALLRTSTQPAGSTAIRNERLAHAKTATASRNLQLAAKMLA